MKALKITLAIGYNDGNKMGFLTSSFYGTALINGSMLCEVSKVYDTNIKAADLNTECLYELVNELEPKIKDYFYNHPSMKNACKCNIIIHHQTGNQLKGYATHTSTALSELRAMDKISDNVTNGLRELVVGTFFKSRRNKLANMPVRTNIIMAFNRLERKYFQEIIVLDGTPKNIQFRDAKSLANAKCLVRNEEIKIVDNVIRIGDLK